MHSYKVWAFDPNKTFLEHGKSEVVDYEYAKKLWGMDREKFINQMDGVRADLKKLYEIDTKLRTDKNGSFDNLKSWFKYANTSDPKKYRGMIYYKENLEEIRKLPEANKMFIAYDTFQIWYYWLEGLRYRYKLAAENGIEWNKLPKEFCKLTEREPKKEIFETDCNQFPDWRSDKDKEAFAKAISESKAKRERKAKKEECIRTQPLAVCANLFGKE